MKTTWRGKFWDIGLEIARPTVFGTMLGFTVIALLSCVFPFGGIILFLVWSLISLGGLGSLFSYIQPTPWWMRWIIHINPEFSIAVITLQACLVISDTMVYIPYYIRLVVIGLLLLISNQYLLYLWTGQFLWHPRHWVRPYTAHRLPVNDLDDAIAWCMDNCRGAWAPCHNMNVVLLNRKKDAAMLKLLTGHIL
jgi:hypothetical protein